MRGHWRLVLGLLLIAVAAVGTVTTYDAPPRAVVTSPTDAGRRLQAEPVHVGRATAHVEVDPGDRRQTWRGVGAALTDASVDLLGDDPGRVPRLDWIRLPLTATDLSVTPWTWGWDGTTASPAPQAEAALAMLDDLVQAQPDLRVVATAWTAPTWMKEPRGIDGGALRDDEVESYGAMLVAQADALQDRGVPLAAMTLGNEPGYGADYPSMTMSDAQQAELARQVGPALHDRGVELWAVDHNWADRPRVDTVLREAPDAFDAAAFHCYAGRPAQMQEVAAPPIVTECTGTRDSWPATFAWDARHLVEESIDAGSTGLLMWSLALDPSGGPRRGSSSAGCQDCRGLVEVEGADVRPQPEHYVLAHLRRAADAGARVLGSTASAGIDEAAFVNPDGTIGVIAHNDTGHEQILGIGVPGRRDLRYVVLPGELVSVRLPG